MDKFDYGRFEDIKSDWRSTFYKITHLLFNRADLFSFYMGIFNILIGELKKLNKTKNIQKR